ncbi:MAG: shikimate dehydrogenase [Candidatus Thermofonsia Clade 1 bacterium]|jgi:predicted amino acid dehydrogenase|uniref:Shikimate dehydrogenase n=1 Tax=Candidatus Thermofonsia Clade 1 bacterium TaxID=2364210 RepID=A0A2M8PEX1_9CHLR|nr:MAG: shikimate dehydrogenase [Candidatus Thermofonsia Clade 1 bacterium]RMF52929.1 MAG: shikimate dehydrogenase [Chloroflexota bacterium]
MLSEPITDTFAFIIHPIHPKRDVSRKFPLLGKLLTEKQVDFLSAYFPPVYISEITGARSAATGREIKGWFIACPFTPKRMLELPVQHVYAKITAAVRKAEKLGAKIVGLGAFTSVVGDAGRTIAERCEVPVTTGDSYTIAIAVEAVRQAAAQMHIALETAKAAVVGATGAIGSVCAEILAADVPELVLVGRREAALAEVRERCEGKAAQVTISTDLQAIYDADLILTVTSAIDAVIFPQHLKPGAVVCDVARPRDVSARVAQERDDVLVIEGGMVEVPGAVDFHFDFGFPRGKAFACMAETMALAMEQRYEDYSIGKALTASQAYEIAAIAAKHGFRLAGFRSFERAVTEEQILRVLERARINRRHWSPLGA